ncbi:MAG: SDR family oxidoreductase [Leptolyngbyaceae cyanobacterium SM1_1_3]|nr:SDR family oxidoreductase [Leptolyngbyaceae cyanobacterium SM1_1_3]NJN01953.1 SDR family oxidoreductase [Leptolyngbyaceae cyanobacterium RM1_1_2]NJO10594.1 SDR family oxidoreductase [Leptolyngbyaceae cyanobacterium SL_1_1]
MKVLVAGATGETGKRIVQTLSDRQIAVKALVRDADKAKRMLPTGVEVVVGDVLDPETLRSALQDCTAIVCATGASPSLDPTGPYKVDYEGTKNLIDVAKSQGIERFVIVSSLCVSKFLHPLNLFWLVLYWKKQAEEYLQKSGLIYTIVRPGGLRNEDDSRPLVMQSADTLYEGNIPRQKVAEVCVEALFQPEADNKIVEIVAEESAEPRSLDRLFASVA